jgi:glycosyltransferase involved in cell wall biosynthesis
MRPKVSVVMPFVGDSVQARAAAEVLTGLDTGPGDELILADNSGTAPALSGITVVRATGEHSPAHARNAGAEHATGQWILFLDSDCQAPRGLIDAYFAVPADPRVGALAGEVVPAADEGTLASRYGASRGFLSQRQHLAHPYRPRAVAANLLVRREAFEQVGGFYEGLRAAEDTDFSWRLQQSGWRLDLRPEAIVEHRYRTSVRDLRRQWRGYAAGRAWLARRYDDFTPQPAAARAASRLRGRTRSLGGGGHEPITRSAPQAVAGPLERSRYLALDALLAGEELAGFLLSNRPRPNGPPGPSRVVLIAERFPSAGDPLIDFARTLERARVEAIARPEAVALDAARTLRIDYREDDGALLRAFALLQLSVRHPLRCLLDLRRRGHGEPRLSALAPAVRRLGREPNARVQALGSGHAQAVARRVAALAGRSLD